jgi:hypothetical protein
MKNKMGLGIILISLLLLVSSIVLAAPPSDTVCKGKCDFFPLNVGDVFIYDVQNSIGETWNMYLWASGEAKIAINKMTYSTFEIMGYDRGQNITVNLGRSTANEYYHYNGKGEEHLAFQNASVGTFWTYERFGHTEKRMIEAIEDITLPAGTFTGCIKTCHYEIDDPANPILYTCEWIKPGFGMVGSIDYYTDNAPVVYVLNSKIKYP